MTTLYTQSNTILHIDDRNELHRGGEGRIMLLNELPNMVAKLYFDPQRALSSAQIRLLQNLDPHYFIVPTELVYDKSPKHILNFISQLTAVGFTMPYLDKHKHTPLSALYSASYCQRHAIGYAQKIAIIRQLAQAIEQAHQQNICIGDLSAFNILIHLPDMRVRLIDTDSYQTIAQAHSGILLDDIRDYFYGGAICRESDYFAFAIVAFQLLSGAHPFKGIHQKYPNLAERMIQRIPIFDSSTTADLIAPKCYIPIAAARLQAQFEEIFKQGKRQLLSLTDADIDINATMPINYRPTTPNIAPISTTIANGLQVQPIIKLNTDEYIISSFALSHRFYIQTNKRHLIFDATNHGFTRLTHQFNANEFEQMWIGKQQIIAQQKNTIVQVQSDSSTHILKNIEAETQSQYVQYDNILTVITSNYLKQWHLDEINGSFMHNEQTAIFSPNFQHSNTAIWQQTDGKQYLFYRSGNSLSNAFCPQNIKEVYLNDNHVLVSYTYIDNHIEKWRHVFGNIQHLRLQLSSVETNNIKHFAYRPLQKGQGILFEPADNALLVRRTEDYTLLQSLICPQLSEQSQLYYTESGIIAIEGNDVLLINTIKH